MYLGQICFVWQGPHSSANTGYINGNIKLRSVFHYQKESIIGSGLGFPQQHFQSMPASIIKLISAIQGCRFGVKHY